MPAYVGNGLVCMMASFKAHATFGFWNAKALQDALGKTVGGKGEDAMGQFGRITRLTDLPSATALKKMVKTAAELDRQGVKSQSRERRLRPALALPDDLAAALALKKNARARKYFDTLSPSHRREYVEWITEAKREETRAKRLATTIEWLLEGKTRHWKYAGC
jgi:uncharacterized protein YdeI (YjbR/CyaY-like superfamily)